MLNEEKILKRALEFEHNDALVEMAGRTGFRHGAQWANEQNAAEIAELKAVLGELLRGSYRLPDIYSSAIERAEKLIKNENH